MARCPLLIFCLAVGISLSCVADVRAQSVLSDSLPLATTPSEEAASETTPGTMVRDSLLRQVRQQTEAWKERYEARTEPAEIEAYQTKMREFFVEQLGGLPERSPLNPQVVDRIERDGFTIEKILFESLPGFHVTGGLFLPDPERFPPPWPAVLVVCGHSAEGKQYEGYQRGTALAAKYGIAGFIIDPIGQGERKQILGEDGKPAVPSATTEHSLLGTAAMLVGWNTARWEIWDGMRAIDYLQSREDIRGDRIGCMGNSGGGTQTSYLMALDERIEAAAPSCYITSFQRLLETIGPQDSEQNIHGQIGFGMDHADYLMMRAPKPTMIACATEDFFDIQGTWNSFRFAKRLYTRLGAAGNMQLAEVDAGHGWHPLLRDASVKFMLQHLTGQVVEVQDSDWEVLSVEEFQVAPGGQVLNLEGEVSAFDQVRQENQRLAEQRRELHRTASRDELLAQIRRLAGVRPLAELPAAKLEFKEPRTVDGVTHQPLVLQVDEDIWLPAVLVRPAKQAAAGDSEGEARPLTCVLHAEGKDAALAAGGVVAERLQSGHTVLAIDIRGVGETLPEGRPWYHERFGRNGGNATVAYLLGKSYVGMRTEDILRAVRWFAESEGGSQVDLMATGELTVPALHAAALEPELFASVELEGGLASWSHLVESPLGQNQVANAVHGALRVYDLPDLAAMLGDRLSSRDPRGAAGEPLEEQP
ncbi:alpha/beta hydrolase family protein [Candidatus Laterigemmans baculatus]|uniref:alpha/beta hydrolase family protein n=1 Tax=Candidatus Laterigemmans baculatus TaxID=2770505 RepID=UPI0013D9FD3F|nr:prolyl oligopeptidase family serine peptidase [Candidatus Laterigemmans baculatus]